MELMELMGVLGLGFGAVPWGFGEWVYLCSVIIRYDAMATVRRMQVLREMELRDDGRGNGVFFAIKFVQGNGELVYFARARSCGLKGNMKKTRRRGVMPVDAAGNDISVHPYPVGIDNILEFNGVEVVF